MERTVLRGGSVVVLLLLIITAGCTASPKVIAPGSLDDPGRGGGWLQQQFVFAAEVATSDFERDVLKRAASTGAIAADDYEEAVSRYLRCAAAAGWEIDAVKQANGVYRWLPQNVTAAKLKMYGEDTNRCAEGTVMNIEGLYKVQVVNPDGSDTPTAVTSCFQEHAVAPASYTAKDFTRDYAENFEHAPYVLSDPNVVMCLTSLGFTVSS